MSGVDWGVLIVYILLIITMSWWIGHRQKNREDYYLGGRSMPAWQIALSIMATQVSAISLIGAPAFVALKLDGGLVWLQYEFAIPLAMILIMLVLVPVYHKTRAITIYEYLEKRFGRLTRFLISLVFLLSRGLGTGVALLATGIVTAVCLQWPLPQTILLIGVVAIIYTTFGGIVADIYSDIIQLAILWLGSIVAIIILGQMVDTQSIETVLAGSQRMQVFDFSHTGLGDGQTFAFWPMLFGGLFLYLSYYGCDQSQAQRLLTTSTVKEAQLALVMNGAFRFLLVLTYVAVGVLMIPFLAANPDFASKLSGNQPDFLMPLFLTEYMPTGILGLLIAGFFAASMSSIDSAINSLSAATYQDFLIRIRPALADISDKKQVRLSRALTVFWGIVGTAFALQMVGGSETVLELVNKIGSAFYGPVLAVFWLGILTRGSRQKGAVTGLISGVLLNIFLWQWFESEVSWMWWNVFGFFTAFIIGIITSRFSQTTDYIPDSDLIILWPELSQSLRKNRFVNILLAVFVMILLSSLIVQSFFA